MKKPLEYFKSKRWIVILAGAALGIFLIAYRPSTASHDAVEEDTCEKIGFYTETLEKRIEALCRASTGIKEVSVLLTLDSGSEYVYAVNQEEKDGTGTKEYLIVSTESGSEPVRVTEIYPRVRGVAVVCTNGDRAEVKEKITSLLSAALGIPSNRIRVSS